MAKKKSKKATKKEDPYAPVFPKQETVPVETNPFLTDSLTPEQGATPPEPEEGSPEAEADSESSRRARLVQKSANDRPRSIDITVPEYDHKHQRLFEAPDGHIMVGGIGDRRMWYPNGNMFINPKHERLTVDERARRSLAASIKDAQE